MKFNEIKYNMRVEDSWYWEWGIGVVKHKGRNYVRVLFSNPDSIHCNSQKEVTYDRSHTQFLRINSAT